MMLHSIENSNVDPKEQLRDAILASLRANGCRITSQRKLILEILLERDCCCSKEIYYRAKEKDDSIGIATIYRMVKTMEEIGAIDRRNMYQIVM